MEGKGTVLYRTERTATVRRGSSSGARTPHGVAFDPSEGIIMTTTAASTLWLAYGTEGQVVGSIRKADGAYTVTLAGADASLGSYPTMEIAKSALHGHLSPGTDWPHFREH
jgi:hypothetical protein